MVLRNAAGNHFGNNDLSRATNIIRQHRPAGRILGLFTAVWLNLALQPCAMALEQDHDCPHCPPAHEQEMAGHHGHGAAADEAPCASMQAPCGDLEDVSLDGRGGQLKVKDVVEAPVAITGDLVEPFADICSYAYSSTDLPLLKGQSPPLHVLNCVYLK